MKNAMYGVWPFKLFEMRETWEPCLQRLEFINKTSVVSENTQKQSLFLTAGVPSYTDTTLQNRSSLQSQHDAAIFSYFLLSFKF